jgi:hypothetical protein
MLHYSRERGSNLKFENVLEYFFVLQVSLKHTKRTKKAEDKTSIL